MTIANCKLQIERYIRQIRFPPLGEEGQRRLASARAMVCGCGALGSVIANTLVRAGVGGVRIVDRDFVELSNLARQTLFDEADAAAGLPKAVAAAEKLRRINSSVEIEPVVADVNHTNIERFCDGVDVILDGTDNFETRFLINDAAVKLRLPWIYGGCVGAEGQTMTIIPGETPCLGCLMQTCPQPGSTPTCDTAGILGPIVGVIASIEAVEAIKILSGNRQAISRQLTIVDLWQNRIKQVDVSRLREQANCAACKRGEFTWLAGREGGRTAALCGRNAVQLSHPGASISLADLAERLAGAGSVTLNQYLLRLQVPAYEITVFADGRAIISGTDDIAAARTIYAKYIGT
ncbi:MAG: ThiF family adenylyltransferase [Thermoguttaceae bacterium]